jgi:hypothetical protein
MDDGSLKLFHFILNGECDATISSDGFFVRFTWNPGPHGYVMELAPTVLGHLLQWSRVEGACRALRAAPLAPHGLKLPGTVFSSPSPGDPRLLWLQDEGDKVRFALRGDSPELQATEWPPEISWEQG